MNEEHVELDTFRRILEAGFRAEANEDRKRILLHLSGPCPVCIDHLHDAIRSAETDWTEMPRRSDPVDRALYRYAALRQVDPVAVSREKQPTAWIRAPHLEACRQVPTVPLAFARMVAEECRRFGLEGHAGEPTRVRTEATLELFEDAQLLSIEPQTGHDLLALLHANLAGDRGLSHEFELARQEMGAAREHLRRGTADAEAAVTLEEIEADLYLKCSSSEKAIQQLRATLEHVEQAELPAARRAETAFRLGAALCDSGKAADALEALALARSTLPAGEDLWLRLKIHHACACAAFKSLDFRSAHANIEDVWELYEESRIDRLLVERDILLGLAYREWRAWEPAERYLRSALDTLLRRALWHDAVIVLVDLARLHARAGDVDKLKALETHYADVLRLPQVQALVHEGWLKLHFMATEAGIDLGGSPEIVH